MNTKELTNNLRDVQKRIGGATRNMSEATDHYVHENVWSSIAVAAVFGCIVGYLLGRRD